MFKESDEIVAVEAIHIKNNQVIGVFDVLEGDCIDESYVYGQSVRIHIHALNRMINEGLKTPDMCWFKPVTKNPLVF